MQPDNNTISGIAVLIISIISMLILTYFGIKYFRNDANIRQGEVLGVGSGVEPLPPTATPAATPTPTTKEDGVLNSSEIPQDWVKYENTEEGYYLFHPRDVKVGRGADGYNWIYKFNEPTTSGVGNYDGIAIRILTQPLNDQDLRIVAQRDADSQEIAEIIKDVEQIELNGVKGFWYSARALGTYKKIFLPVEKSNSYMEIISTAVSSDNSNYTEISEKIISTIKILN